MSKLKIIPNPDKKVYEEVSQAVKDCNGFCPCFYPMDQSPGRKCICKYFKDQTEPGPCHCGRFIKILVEDNANTTDKEV